MASGGNSPVAGVRIGAIAPGKALNELWGYDKNSDTSAEVDNGSGITDADVADAVHYMLTRPRHVTIHDLVLLPSAQEI
jgi:ribitol 2-dehydrogenase